MTVLRLLVTGSRTWDDRDTIHTVLDKLLADHEALITYHGACPAGADAIADAWALERRRRGAPVDVRRVPPLAQEDGPWPGAGPRRNARMVRLLLGELEEGERAAAVAFLRGGSSGTRSCIRAAQAAGLDVTTHHHIPKEAPHA